MTPAARARLKVDVVIDSDRWKRAGNVKPIIRRAVMQAARMLSTRPTELAIVLADDSTVRQLNRHWRGIDAATNVLSFSTKPAKDEPHHLGDIVLACETIAREARAEHKQFAHHVAHLAVHGFLHLLGHDHERDDEAEAMEQLERKILRRLSIADPYRKGVKRAKRAANKS
jgi:probable rRNA maturation factor